MRPRLAGLIVMLLYFAAPVPAASWTPEDGVWFEEPPPFRVGHSAVYDSLRHRMIVIGGGGGCMALDLGGSGAWYPLVTTGTGPPTTSPSFAVLDRVHQRVLVMGELDQPGLWSLSLGTVPHWSLLSASPQSLGLSTTFYDEARDRLVAYDGGGIKPSTSRYMGRLFTLPLSDPAGWSTRYVMTGRGPRSTLGPAVAYDPLRHRMLVFGGDTLDSYPSDEVWALSLDDDVTWTRLSSGARWTEGRRFASMVYDPVDDQLLIAGGEWSYSMPSSAFSSLIAFPLSGGRSPSYLAWAGTGFWGAWDASLVVDPETRRAIFHAGRSLFDSYADTWMADLSTPGEWVRFAPLGKAPSGRGYASAMFDSDSRRIVLFGGTRNSFYNLPATAMREVNVLGPQGWEAIAEADLWSIPGRWGASIVHDAGRQRGIVFGGADNATTFSDTWALALPVVGKPIWTRIETAGTAPALRYHHAIIDAPRDRMIVFGGQDASGYRTDVWELALAETPTWSLLSPSGTPPPAAWSAIAAHDRARHRMWVLVTRDSAYQMVADLWSLDLVGEPAWTRVPVRGVSPWRWARAIVLDTRRDRIIGLAPEGVFAVDLAGTPRLYPVQPANGMPGFYLNTAAVYDSVDDRIVTFGGAQNSARSGQTWSLRFGTSYLPVEAGVVPTRLRLALAGANPTTGSVPMRLDLPARAHVRVEVFDLAGRRIATPLARRLEAGRHDFGWDGRGLAGEPAPTGVFLVRATADREVATIKVVRIR